jgi:uncharacterized protein
MHVSLFDVTVDQFTRSLNAFKQVLVQTQAWADSKKIDDETLVNLRLIADQFPFKRQVQIASDVAKMCVAKLSGQQPPVFKDEENSLPELIERVDKTIAYLQTVKSPEAFQGFEQQQISFPWYPGKYLEGKAYLVQHSIPNFYFHITTAYSILRSQGMNIGKVDFLGHQDWKNSTK